MGQTLTHGVYLPDEGERNCYSGLAANWQILDSSVGTIAAHTAALAGKAADSDVVHKTGNESIAGNKTFTGTTRLSFQEYISANLDVGVTPSSAIGATLYFAGNNDGQIGYARSVFYQNGVTQTEVAVRNKFTNGALDPNGTYVTATINIGLTDAGDPYITTNGKFRANLLPSATNAYDLGSSAYQWNNLYAKNYYYNGVAFTDKFVTTDTEQTITKTKTIQIDDNTIPDIYHLTSQGFCRYRTRGSSNYRNYDSYLRWGHTGHDNYFVLNRSVGVLGDTTAGATIDDIDTSFNLFKIHIKSKSFDIVDSVKATNDGTENSLKPITTSVTDLGTSTNKWKTLNGINPGALSLPDLDNTYRWSLDTTNWVLDGSSNNTFTPNFSGWLNIRIPDAAGNYIIMQSGSITVSNQGTGALASTITRPLSLLIPVIEGVSGLIRVNAASIIGFFYPALGNPIKTIQPSS